MSRKDPLLPSHTENVGSPGIIYSPPCAGVHSIYALFTVVAVPIATNVRVFSAHPHICHPLLSLSSVVSNMNLPYMRAQPKGLRGAKLGPRREASPTKTTASYRVLSTYQVFMRKRHVCLGMAHSKEACKCQRGFAMNMTRVQRLPEAR
jgi:hypothetical protein